MASKNVNISKKLEPTTQPGRHFRLVCLTGKEKGTSYYLTGHRILVGRGDHADIQVLDSTVSKEHAELIVHGENVILTDLGHQNGTLVNSSKIVQKDLESGDSIIMGQSVYKFYKIFNEDTLKKELKEETEEEIEEDEENTLQKDKKRKNIIIIAAVAILVLFMGEEDEKKGVNEESGNPTETVISEQIRRPKLNPQLKEKFDMYLHRGIREYREGNYFRAIGEFDMALTLNPKEGRASFHKNKASNKIEKTIEDLFVKVTRDRDALKYNSAMVSLCEIIKLLSQYEDEEKRELAYKIIREIQTKTGTEENEDTCSI